jgi:hypothetical protein
MERYGELEFTSEILGENNSGNGTIEILYNIKYWDKCDERRTYVNC